MSIVTFLWGCLWGPAPREFLLALLALWVLVSGLAAWHSFEIADRLTTCLEEVGDAVAEAYPHRIAEIDGDCPTRRKP